MAKKSAKNNTAEAALEAVEKALEIDFTTELQDTLDQEATHKADQIETENSLKRTTSDAQATNEDLEIKFDSVDLLSDSDITTLDATEKLTSGTEALAAGSLTSGRTQQQTQKNEFSDSIDKMDVVTPSSSPANDDRQRSVSNLLYNMQQRPSRRIFIFVTMLTLLWIGAGFGLCYWLYGADIFAIRDLEGLKANPGLIAITVGTFVPVFLFYAFASLVFRANDLRLAARSITEAAVRLVEPEDIAQEKIHSVGQAVRREVNAMSDGVEKALTRASELEVLVHNEVNSLERAYFENENRMRGLVSELSSERESVVNHAERVRESIAGAQETLREELQATSDKITQSVSESSALLTNSVSDKGEEITASLNSVSENLLSMLSISSNELMENFGNTGNSLVDKINLSATAIHDSINSQTNGLTGQLTTAGNTIANLIETRSSNLLDQTQSITQTLNDALSLRSSELLSNIENASETLHSGLDGRIEQINDTLITRGTALVDSLGDRASSIAQTLSNGAEEFEARSQKIDHALQLRGEAISETLLSRTKEVASVFASGNEQINQLSTQTIENLKAQTQATAQMISEQSQTLGNTVKESTAEFESNISKSSDNLIANLATTSERQIAALNSNAEIVANAISGQTDLMSDRFASKVDESTRALTVSADKIQNSLENSTQQSVSAMKDQADALEEAANKHFERMQSKSTQIVADIEQQTSSITDKLETGTVAISQALSKRTGEIASKLGENVQGITDTITDEALNAAKLVEQSVSKLNGQISSTLNDAENAIGARAESISAALEERTSNLNDMLVQRSQEISGLLDANSAPILQEIESKGQNIVASITNSAQAASDRLTVEQHNLNTAFQEASTAASASVASANETLRKDVGQLLSRVAQSNDVLRSLIEDAGARLNDVQESLVEKTASLGSVASKATGDLQTSSQEIEANLGRLSEISNLVMSGISAISGEFQSQGNSLASAVEMINSTQTNLDMTSEERKRTIEELSQALTIRSADIERQMTAFSQLINNTLSTAENRAREIGNILARTSEDASQTLTSQLSNLSTAADDESRRAVAVIHAASQGLAGEVTSAIEEAAKRFTVATDEMRMTAQKVSSELSTTRDEMRKGIFELPEETKENTAALRRAVGDQIRALKDLSGIVSQTKTAYGSTAPIGNNTRPQSELRGAQSITSKSAPDLRPSMPALEPATSTGSVDFDRVLQSRPTPSASGINSFVKAPDTGSKGWVSDLLARASQDHENTGGSGLSSLSNDISNAVNHHAADELWRRYLAGERGLFSPAIYTVNGRSVYEQVRTKYASDTSFRGHVDRYIQDFERALADIARNDADNTQTQAILVSENGKVYTLLAHASGRLI